MLNPPKLERKAYFMGQRKDSQPSWQSVATTWHSNRVDSERPVAPKQARTSMNPIGFAFGLNRVFAWAIQSENEAGYGSRSW